MGEAERPRVRADAGLGVGAVARRLGVAPSTLRTWDRRYGIGPSGRSPGGHRRYTADDLARLEDMQRSILTGASPAEAARVALGAPLVRPVVARGHGAGGNRVPLSLTSEGAADRARGLARAAMALDATAMTATARAALAQDGVVAAWNGVFVPVLDGIGRKHAASGSHVEVEHLLSAVLVQCLTETTLSDGARPRLAGRPVLLACAPEEQHSLPVYALAAALEEAGIAATVLGARVPSAALTAAIERIGPRAVFVWSQTSDTGDPSWLADLPRTRPPLRTVIGGPGWARGRVPDGVRLVASLPEAVGALGDLNPRP
ncbi:MerR family transcriptional regulator [Actinomadura harenae]|uniref:MerR family transcriptional regulator n=1 Tax=Actinomadura harenae TaxID=2483351 RepID=UPI00131537A7|nr:MerR family transcriptional regulator [Actinomadura harenae]